jgi:hypothetical protein
MFSSNLFVLTVIRRQWMLCVTGGHQDHRQVPAGRGEPAESVSGGRHHEAVGPPAHHKAVPGTHPPPTPNVTAACKYVCMSPLQNSPQDISERRWPTLLASQTYGRRGETVAHQASCSSLHFRSSLPSYCDVAQARGYFASGIILTGVWRKRGTWLEQSVQIIKRHPVLTDDGLPSVTQRT